MSDEVWTSDGVFPSEFEHNRVLAGGTPEDQQVVEKPGEPKIDWWKGIKAYVQQSGEQIVNTLKVPGEAFKGNLSQEEITQGGVDVAMLVGGLSTPFVKPGLGIFGGRVTSREVSRAQHMEENIGGSVGDIKQYSGLERGADNRWLYEFNISKEHINLEDKVFSKILDNKGMPIEYSLLKDVVKYPDLHARYPELSDVVVKRFSFKKANKYYPEGFDPETYGYWMPSAKQIYLNTDHIKKEGLHSTFIHELQHAVQNIDERAAGSVESLPKEVKDKAMGYFARETIKDEAIAKGHDPNLVLELISKEDPLVNKKWAKAVLETAAQKTYKALRGEVEARNAEYRAGLTPKERMLRPGVSTEDVPRAYQIDQDFNKNTVRFGPKMFDE